MLGLRACGPRLGHAGARLARWRLARTPRRAPAAPGRARAASADAADVPEPPSAPSAPRTWKKQPKLGSPERPRPPPTFVRPPSPPESPETFKNMVLLVDKPRGYTSFDVVARVRGIARRMGVKKVGHCGTLDPMATGVLVLCVGQATKLVDSYTGMDKAYVGTMKLGERTPSQDADTAPDATFPWEGIADDELRDAAAKLVGDLKQLPPMYSAIKVKGKRLYESARKGEVVERKTRDVRVDAFEVERDATNRQLVHFKVECGKGTYVRTLAHDLGESLGSAAHLTALRRVRVGEYDVDDAWTIDMLNDACAPMVEAAEDAKAAAAAAAAAGGR